MRWFRLAVALSVLGAAAPSASVLARGHDADSVAARALPLPQNMVVARIFVPVLQQVLAQSTTFRTQCLRIRDAPRLHVRVLPVFRNCAVCPMSARTMFRRYPSGVLIAEVEIPAPLTLPEYGELLGHEFEHIVEQIDDVDLVDLADKGTGVTQLGNGAYETKRARKAGRTVGAEVLESTRHDPEPRASSGMSNDPR